MPEPERPDSTEAADSKLIAAGDKSDLGSKSTDLSNSMLGEFRLLRKLGAGGMAEVYLAEQTTLRRQVAVKILKPEFITDEKYLQRFRHEAAAAGSLNHPNIVQVYMVGEQNHVSYIAQEYVQGRTLKDQLKRKGPLDFKLALHILRQVASALQAAAENGIVHRDIKPENILLNNKGEAKVTDFGLAQLTLQGERVSLTQPGMTMGTPLYMSPEQVNGQPLDARSDIYSFGIMAWHMLAGRPPFSGETAMSVAVKHLNEKPPELTDFRPDVPKPLQDLVKRMIQKNKADRPQDFATILTELKQMIRQFMGREPATIALSIPVKTSQNLFDRPFRQQLKHCLLAGLVSFALFAGIGWAMRVPDISTIASTGTPKVREMPTITAQYYYAETNPLDEAAWIAVKEFPGANDDYKAEAQAALAIIYLKTNRQRLAESIFRDLEADSKFRADGLAGLALVAHFKGDDVESKRLINQVLGLNVKLFSELDTAFKDLRQRIDPKK